MGDASGVAGLVNRVSASIDERRQASLHCRDNHGWRMRGREHPAIIDAEVDVGVLEGSKNVA